MRSAKIARKSAKSAPKNVNKAELNFFFEEKKVHPLSSKAKWYYCSLLSQVHPLFGTPSPSCQLEGSVKRNQTSQKSSQIFQKRNGLKKVRILTFRGFWPGKPFPACLALVWPDFFVCFGCEMFCKQIMAGLFGFFLPFPIF